MEIEVVIAPVFAANCVVVAAEEGVGADAVIIDAGGGAAAGIIELIERRGWRPRAVLATHGHVDHTWDAAELCERYSIPMRIHEADAYRLQDPFGTLGAVGPALRASVAAMGAAYSEPATVVTFDATGDDGDGNVVAGDLRMGAIHAPGHTEGSMLYLIDGRVLLTGDVLFMGGIGRTDLPGGAPATMADTLTSVVAGLDPGLAVIPGHGPSTTIGRELATNPYLSASTPYR